MAPARSPPPCHLILPCFLYLLLLAAASVLSASHGLAHLSSNVLLRPDYAAAALCDFCLDPIYAPSSIRAGVGGYRAPEVVDTRGCVLPRRLGVLTAEPEPAPQQAPPLSAPPPFPGILSSSTAGSTRPRLNLMSHGSSPSEFFCLPNPFLHHQFRTWPPEFPPSGPWPELHTPSNAACYPRRQAPAAAAGGGRKPSACRSRSAGALGRRHVVASPSGNPRRTMRQWEPKRRRAALLRNRPVKRVYVAFFLAKSASEEPDPYVTVIINMA
ncbi:hypothetical protein TRIUR3_21388 [Triticum urartu]|uniref:Uncharacterized protein n=1 Tax=Triticum urartu TaxID=4572 RepID=M7ZTS3_TRIUA|nr:hypothetical protein TRIUR3_21388 [Triticum urartu]